MIGLASLRDKLDRQVASLQAQIGRFLIQKERILNMPQGPKSDYLYDRQASLESRAMALLASAGTLKAKLDAPFDPLSPASYSRVVELIKPATSLGQEAVKLREQMASHVNLVDSALAPASTPGQPPSIPQLSPEAGALASSWPLGLPAWVWGVVAVGVAWKMVKR